MGGYFTTPYGSDRITQLMLEGGDIAAQGAQRSGQIWGGAIQGLGQIAGNAFQNYAEQKKQRDEEAKVKAAAQKMAVRDAAWVKFVNDGEWMKSPEVGYKGAMTIFGPKDGVVQFQALQGAANLMNPKVDEDKALKSAGNIIRGMEVLPPQARAALYPQARQLVQQVPWLKDYQLPEQYEEQAWTERIAPLGPVLRGEKPAESKPETRNIEIQMAEASARGDTAAYNRLLKVRSDLSRADDKPAGPAKDSGADNRIWVNRGGQVVRIREDQYQPGDTPMSTREQGRPVTSGDAGRIADFDTSLDDLTRLRDTITGETGTLSRIGAAMPPIVTELTGWGEDAKARQATIDRVKQVIGKTLEGGVLRKEDEEKYKKILPTIGDPPAVAKAKLDGLEQAIRQRRERQIESLGDAGYDVSKFEARAPAAPGVKPIVQHSPSTGQYRYSLDGGKTWLPGKP